MEYILYGNGQYFMQTLKGNKMTTDISLASRWKKAEKAQHVLEHNCVNKKFSKHNFQVLSIDENGNISTIAGAAKTENAAKVKRKSFTQEQRAEVYRKTKGYCYLCGDFVDFTEFEIEHKVPISKGGTNDISNLFCSCHVCNSIKQDIYPEDFMERISKIFMHQMENKYSKKMTWKMMSKKLHKMIGGN